MSDDEKKNGNADPNDTLVKHGPDELDRRILIFDKDRESAEAERAEKDRRRRLKDLTGKPVDLEVLLNEPLRPKEVVEGLLPVGPFTINGAGGISKTTQALRIAVDVALGRPVFEEFRVSRDGPVLLASREDDLDLLRWRLHQVVKALKLNDQDKARLAKRLFIESLTESTDRMVEFDREEFHLRFGPLRARLIEAYDPIRPVLVMLDPAVHFGAGEQFLNDGPAMLMQALKTLSTRWQCAAGIIHHVSQNTARAETVDQYAGRGGTALADNSRSVIVMVPHEKASDRFVVPEGVPQHAVDAGRVTRITIEKYSIGKRERRPIFAVRGAGEEQAFHFTYHMGVRSTGEDRAEAKQQERDRALEDLRARIYDHIAEEVRQGKYPTRNSVCVTLAAQRNRVLVLIKEMVASGNLADESLPEELRQRNAKTFLTTVTRQGLKSSSEENGAEW